MFRNLFERIINAVRPTEKSEQPSDAPQSWPESSNDQPAAPQEQNSDAEEMADSTHQTDSDGSYSQQRDF
ncbi:MAG: hypothetical protein ACYS1A_07680 [Planctomycetota bacterium]